MAPKRILFVEINEDGTVGGSHQALLDLVHGLDKQRFTPIIVAYQDSSFVPRWREAGAEVLTWDAPRALERRGRIRSRIENFFRAIPRRVRLIREQRIDLVHINNSPVFTWEDWLPAARKAGVPIISHVRGDPMPTAAGAGGRQMCEFDRLLTISEFIDDEVRANGLPPERITLTRDGVDAEVVRSRVTRDRAATRAELGVRDDQLLAVMVGHFRSWKGQDVVVRALGGLSAGERDQVVVAFAGAEDRYSPGYREGIAQVIAEQDLAGSVRLLGPRRDVPNLMTASDFVLHASTIPEPFGLVIVEALALGRPVIASSLGAPAEIITPQVGWTFDPREPEALTALLREIIGNRSEVTRRAAVATARADEFDIQTTLDSVQAVYDSLLDARAAG